MCGIVGTVSLYSRIDRTVLDLQRDTLSHRGPDDAGSWYSEDGRIGFAHRRLSVIDLTADAHQPMVDRDAGLVLVYNGELYNFIELREELQQCGVVFHSSGDTEVVLQAYRTWGAECLRRLDGMFAFAIYDGTRRRIFMARDRAGEKPLYYCRLPGELHFASELKALMAHPRMDRAIDPDALNSYLAFGYIPGSQCILKGMHKLSPAHSATFHLDDDRFELRRFWSLPTEVSDGPGEEDELLRHLEEVLERSVRRRLISDVPVGIMLSGGIDSSIVAALAARVSGSPVTTFTISFPGHRHYDEGPYARRVAEHLGTRHIEMPAEPATVDVLPLLARQYDEPMADSSMVPTYLVSRQIRGHATVALGGDGGDELFGGYPGHSWIQSMSRFRRRIPLAIRRMLLSAAQRGLQPGRLGRNYILGLLSDEAESIVQINKFFDPPDRKKIMAEPMRRLLSDTLDAPEAWKAGILARFDTPLRKIAGMDFMSYLPDDILVKVDRASMLTSLEVRAPFLAREVVEFAFGRLPDRLRATDTETKIITRRLAARLLPEDLDLDRKQGFTLPLQAWFRGTWGGYIREVLMDGAGEVFRRNVIEKLLREQMSGRRHTQRLFSLAIFELWRKEYGASLP